ncbi:MULTISPECIES: hypothetical protein [Henriciella]|jgi:hypothetical protein|uniref:hypothetical protein n=1 Tax=Henriciella TaxID=453849 RepID=UPI003517B1F9
MKNPIKLILSAIATLNLVTACTTAQTSEPATLTRSDDTTLSRVKSVLAEAMGRNDIRLGAGDLTEETSLTVLPPSLGPLETSSPAIPIPFDIVTDGRHCFVVRRETGEKYRLSDVNCVAAPRAQASAI